MRENNFAVYFHYTKYLIDVYYIKNLSARSVNREKRKNREVYGKNEEKEEKRRTYRYPLMSWQSE